MGDLLYFFGYANCDEDSLTNFFSFDTHSDESKKLYNGFKKANQESMQEILSKVKQIKLYTHNRGQDMIPFLSPDFLKRIQEPGLDYA